MNFDFHGQQFICIADRALWWPARKTLVVADVHLGKGATFRASGLGIPSGSSARDLARLTGLIAAYRPERLLVLGDLVHAAEAGTLGDAIASWRRAHGGLFLQLVIGNHDRAGRTVPHEFLIDASCDCLEEAGVCFVHNPADAGGRPAVAGHVHPATHLFDFDGSAVKVPCFVIDPTLLLLPAFALFTGGAPVQREPGRRLIALAAGRLVEVKNDRVEQKTGRPRARS